jgi:DNA-damage-inducible protein J
LHNNSRWRFKQPKYGFLTENSAKRQHFEYKCFTFESICSIFSGMSTVVTNIRLDKELKTSATELFDDLGLSLSQAITVFLKQSLLHHGLPFAVTRPPSKELLEAIKEGENLARDPNAKTYASPKELWDDLGL